MPRYYFHTADGHRRIDPVGLEFDTEPEARREAARLAGEWLTGNPTTLMVNHEYRVEVTLADLVPLYSVVMFGVDPRSFGKGG